MNIANQYTAASAGNPGAAAFQQQVQDSWRDLRWALLDEIECGLIVCDAAGTVRFVNRAARAELARGHVLRRVGDALQPATQSWENLEAALFQAARQGKRRLLRLGSGAHRLLVSIQPLRSPDSGQTFALVMLGRRHACSDLGIEMLAACCGLTLAERKVLSALVREMPPKEIASALSVALTTVRTHITSIRNKLGARSIDALLLRAAEVPPVTSALHSVGDTFRSACCLPGEPAHMA